MSRWMSGFMDVCRVNERRTAECRVDECLGSQTPGDICGLLPTIYGGTVQCRAHTAVTII